MKTREAKLNRIGTTVIASLIVSTLAFAAVRADGFHAAMVKLHDSGIWIVKNDLIGRFNHDLGKVDTQSARFASAVDLQQIDATVVVTTKAPPSMHRFNVATDSVEGAVDGVVLPQNAIVSIGGDNGALLDPDTGRVWFTSADAVSSVKAEDNKSFVTLEGASGLAVGNDGVAHVVAKATGNVWTLRDVFKDASQLASAASAGPATTDVAATSTTTVSEQDKVVPPKKIEAARGDVQLSTARSRLVFFDPTTGQLTLDDGSSFAVAGADASSQLQQPGDDPSHVLISTSKAMLLVDLGSHSVRVLGNTDAAKQIGDGAPIAPVWLHGCAYGAWAAVEARYCPGNSIYDTIASPGETALKFRINHALVALNFVSGHVVDMSEGTPLTLIKDDWSGALNPDDTKQQDNQPSADPSDQVDTCKFDSSQPNSPPIAVDDSFGVRRGQPAVFDVISGVGSADKKPDSDPDCDVLTVQANLTDPKGALPDGAGSIAVIRQGRALEYLPPDDPSKTPSSFAFSYTLSDGHDHTATATVSVTVFGRQSEQNDPPQAGNDQTSVEQGKTAEVNVLANDIDPNGDPLVVTAASILGPNGDEVGLNGPDGDSIVWQANGRLAYTAPAGVTRAAKVRYYLSDGAASPVLAEVDISMIPAGAGQNKEPNAANDAVVGTAGQDLSVNVLANDSDPNGDALTLAQVQPDDSKTPQSEKWTQGGTIKIQQATEGVYNYAYQVTDGNGGVAWARVRFTVLAAGANHPPVAVRDDAVVSPGNPTMVDVLSNDFDIDGDVLMITSVTTTSSASSLEVSAADALSIEVLDHRIIRVTSKSAAVPGSTYQFNYRVSDGTAEAIGSVSVRVAQAAPGQPPITKPDHVSVHLGGVVGIPVLANDYDPDGLPLQLIPGSARITGTSGGADEGTLFTEADRVVYVATSAAATKQPFTVQAEYQVTAGGHIKRETIVIDVQDFTQNAAPDPPPLLVRTFVGHAPMQIPLPVYDLDPNGDPVIVLPRVNDTSQVHLGFISAFDSKTRMFTYTPGTTPGREEFTFPLHDTPAEGQGADGNLTIRIVISARNADRSPPVAVDDTFPVLKDSDTTLPILLNDTDPDGFALLLSSSQPVDTSVRGGTVAATTDLTRVVFHATGALGDTTQFHYYLVDDHGGGPVIGTVHVKIVDHIDEAPLIARADPQPPAKPGDVLKIDVLANDKFPVEDPVSVICPPAVLVNCAPTDVIGPDGSKRQGLQITMGTTPLTFYYTIVNTKYPDIPHGAAQAMVQIPLALPDNPPTCEPHVITVAASDPSPYPVKIDFANWCTDPDPDAGDSVSLSDAKPVIATADGAGALNDTALQWNDDKTSFNINRKPEFSGDLVIQYRVKDKSLKEALGQITLTISGHADHAPTVPQSLQKSLDAGAPAVDLNLKSLGVNDPDPGDNQLLHFSLTNNSATKLLTATMSPEGLLTLQVKDETAVTNETGPKQVDLSYTVDDTRGQTTPGTVTVTVTPSNKPGPTAQNDSMGDVKQGSTATLNVLANDLLGDPQDTQLAPLQVSTPDMQATGPNGTAGSVHITATGDATFTPAAGFHGKAVFSYTIQDARKSPSKQGHATVTVNVIDKPDRPAQPSVGPQQSGAAEVTFTDTPDNGKPITNYRVIWAGGQKDCGPAAGKCVVTGLTNHATYEFQVIATNTVGDSLPSDQSQPYTPDQVPDQPNQPTADWGDQSATVNWANINNPGSPLVKVVITVSPPDAQPFVGPGTATGTHVFTGLRNGTPYTFTITAVNSAKPTGESAPSVASQPVVPAGNPIVPATAPQLVKGDAQVVASWAPADSNGDPSGLTYTVDLINTLTSAVQTVGPLTATANVVIPATNGQTYKIKVHANNKATVRTGKAVDYADSNTITPSGKPKAPSSVAVILNLPNAVKIHVGDTNNNGNAIVGYQVSANGAAPVTLNVSNPTGAALDLTVPNLTNGTAYTFTVAAINGNGTGDFSTPSGIGTPYDTPALPTATCIANGLYITCTWATNALNGPAGTGTVVTVDSGVGQISTAPSGNWPQTPAPLGFTVSRNMTVTVCNGGTYRPGEANNCSTKTTGATTDPEPTPVSVCSTSGNVINCNWYINGVNNTITPSQASVNVDVDGAPVGSGAQYTGSWSSGPLGATTTHTMHFRLSFVNGVIRDANPAGSATFTYNPPPTTWVEIAWGPPGTTVPLFSGGPGVNSDGSSGPAATIGVGTHITVNCRSYNQAIAPGNTGGWWYHISAGGYAGYWTPASDYENGDGPYPASGTAVDPNVPGC